MTDEAKPIPHAEVAQQLTNEQRQLLSEEAQRMQTLYLDARNNAQNIFNFYLTFVTAVVGGLIFVFQASDNAFTLRTRIIIIILLLFSVLVGSVYLSALSGRYAQSARFAHALDVIRRLQLKETEALLAPLYTEFLKDNPHRESRMSWYIWIFPSGTFQMFVSFVNGASLTLALILLINLGDVSPTTNMILALLIFALTVTIYNVYSHLVINRFTHALDVRIDMGHQLDAWAARE